MTSGAIRSRASPRSGSTAAGCASVNGMRVPSARRAARDHCDVKVAPDPLLAGAEGEIDEAPGAQSRGVDLDEVQPERVGGGRRLARLLPAVESETHRARRAQRDGERAALGQLGDRTLLGPDEA